MLIRICIVVLAFCLYGCKSQPEVVIPTTYEVVKNRHFVECDEIRDRLTKPIFLKGLAGYANGYGFRLQVVVVNDDKYGEVMAIMTLEESQQLAVSVPGKMIFISTGASEKAREFLP